MRILLVSQHYPPDSGATGRLSSELAGALVRRGHRVTVLAGRPSYPGTRGLRPASHETADGVEIVRVPTAVRREGVAGRGIHYLSFAAAALLKGMSLPRHDVTVAFSSTPPFGGPAALLLARARRCPFVYGVQDVHPEMSVAMGALREGPVVRAMRRLEALAWRGADRVVVIADELRAAAHARGVPDARVVTVRNWADARRITPRRESALRKRVGFADDDFVVQYAGNFGRAQDLETVFEAVRRAGRTDGRVKLLLVGDGSARASVERRAAMVPGAVVVPFQPEEQVADVLAAADLAIVALHRALTRWCVPSKIYSILASGRPVGAVLDAGSEVARTVASADCGFRVDPGDAAGLAREILRLSADRDRARRQGVHARRWIEAEGGLDRAAAEWEAVLEKVSRSSRSGAVAPTLGTDPITRSPRPAGRGGARAG